MSEGTSETIQLNEPRQFMVDDPGYLDWAKDHQSGYVVTYMGGPKPFAPVLHKAGCRTIAGTPAPGTFWTGTWLLACSPHGEELCQWVKSQGGEDPRPCMVCHP